MAIFTKFPGGSYTVKKGDTLYNIVKRYNPGATDPEIFREENRLRAVNMMDGPDYLVIDEEIADTASSKTSPSNAVTTVSITTFGISASMDRTAVVKWSWDKHDETGKYEVVWEYETIDKNRFKGATNTTDPEYSSESASKFDTFKIPEDAYCLYVRVRPIPKDEKNSSTKNWTWTEWRQIYLIEGFPPENPTGLEVEVKDYKLTATLRNIDTDKINRVEFRLREETSSNAVKTEIVKVDSTVRIASISFGVSPGVSYVIEYRASKNILAWSDWSDVSGPYYTAPSSPTLNSVTAIDEVNVRITWSKVSTADGYKIEYATDKSLFDGSNQTTTESVDDGSATTWNIKLNESGKEYFFRVRAKNEGNKGAQYSEWSSIKSLIIGEKPSPPTTWSSVSTAVVGETVYLYWVHNSVDGSIQRFANLKINGEITKITNNEEAEEGGTSMYELNTSGYTSGAEIQWSVQTIGAIDDPSDWSTERTITVHARPTLALSMTDKSGQEIYTLRSFPFNISCEAFPTTQIPISYHIDILANESYNAVNNVGNEITVSKGTSVYSKYFDGFNPWPLSIKPSDVNLENGASYTLKATVFMDSGLTAEDNREFTVSYDSSQPKFALDAIISFNEDLVTTTVVPYCENRYISFYKANKVGNLYTTTTEQLGLMYRIEDKKFSSAIATTGETVYYGASADDGENYYYYEVETAETIYGMLLSVYRREFDGSFTELSKDLPSENWTAVPDPHPALDYARYRIVAKSNETGEITYYDAPAFEIGVKYVVLQWDEAWSEFDYSDKHEIAKPPWSGSLLKLPYNIDVSDSYDADVTLVNYIGREHPVSYYGTQIGQTATWEMSVDKTDAETLYGLRRLARYMGDVYVREPSGSGYWARVKVSFNQKHTDPIAPVSLEITRVYGGA